MPMAGKGMLMTSMNIDAAHEAEFNLWYDREHLAERVAIEGFIEARRYVADEASPKYLGLYSTETFGALTSAAYRTALANQTAWSKTQLARFRDMGRAIARITASRGQGRGAVLGLMRLRPKPGASEALRSRIAEALCPGTLPAILSMHLLESDPTLSISLTDPDAPNPGAADWYVLVDGSDTGAVSAILQTRFDEAMGQDADIVSTGTFRLMWDLARADL